VLHWKSLNCDRVECLQNWFLYAIFELNNTVCYMMDDGRIFLNKSVTVGKNTFNFSKKTECIVNITRLCKHQPVWFLVFNVYCSSVDLCLSVASEIIFLAKL